MHCVENKYVPYSPHLEQTAVPPTGREQSIPRLTPGAFLWIYEFAYLSCLHCKSTIGSLRDIMQPLARLAMAV